MRIRIRGNNCFIMVLDAASVQANSSKIGEARGTEGVRFVFRSGTQDAARRRREVFDVYRMGGHAASNSQSGRMKVLQERCGDFSLLFFSK